MTDSEVNLEGSFPYTCPIVVRTNDIDRNGHVNNTAHPIYFEQARATYFRSLFSDNWGASSVVVANIEIDYLAPIELDDTVHVDLGVREVGSSSWTIEYRLRANDRVAATGRSTQVAWDRETATSQSLPDGWRTALEAELVAPRT